MKSSSIDVWHGFGNFTGLVSHDGATGNAAASFIEIGFGESEHPGLKIEN